MDHATADLRQYQNRQDQIDSLFDCFEDDAIDALVDEMLDTTNLNGEPQQLAADLAGEEAQPTGAQLILLAYGNAEQRERALADLRKSIQSALRDYLTDNEQGERLVADRVHDMAVSR